MKEGYKALGEFIRQIDIRNTEGKEDNLLGVSVQKQFIPSIANTVGTDFTKYKVVKKGQFTYIPDTSRRGDKIAIALLQDYEEGLVSNVYTVFEVIDEEKLLPEYLMLSLPDSLRIYRNTSSKYVRYNSSNSVTLPPPFIYKTSQRAKPYKKFKKFFWSATNKNGGSYSAVLSSLWLSDMDFARSSSSNIYLSKSDIKSLS